MNAKELPEELEAALRRQFADAWPPDDETIDNLTTKDNHGKALKRTGYTIAK